MDVKSTDIGFVESTIGNNASDPINMTAEGLDKSNNIIRGALNFDRSSLANFDPSYTGYTQIFVLRGPRFLQDYKAAVPTEGTKKEAAIALAHFKNLKAALELASTSYNGTPDLTLNMTEINTGFSDKAVSVPTYAAFDGKNFTIKTLEFRGEPVRKALEYLITSISDPSKKAANMRGSSYEATLENISFEIVVVQTDQTLTRIQNYDLWQCSIPTTVPRDSLNWDAGNIDIVQGYDIQFVGYYVPRPAKLEDYVKKLLASRLKLYKNFTELKVGELPVLPGGL